MTTRGMAGAIERALELIASASLAVLGLAWLAPPPALAAFPGHNGQIAFQSDRDGRHPDVYAMNPDGGCVTRLTHHPSLDGFPTWSPDGQRIAFVSTRDGVAEIYVMNADGHDQQRLTDNPSWDGGPAWSPDGQRIAFRSDRAGDPEIYVMNADGSNPIRLTRNPGWDGAPTWSPDGGRIAFMSIREPTLIPGAGHPNSQIYTMNPDGSNQIRVTDTSAADGAPDWSPDGRRIAFDSNLDGSFQIHAITPSGTNLTRLTDSSAVDGGPAWSPDGRQVAFRSDRDGVNQIHVMNPDGSHSTRLTNGSSNDRRGEPAAAAASREYLLPWQGPAQHEAGVRKAADQSPGSRHGDRAAKRAGEEVRPANRGGGLGRRPDSPARDGEAPARPSRQGKPPGAGQDPS